MDKMYFVVKKHDRYEGGWDTYVTNLAHMVLEALKMDFLVYEFPSMKRVISADMVTVTE